MSHEKIYFNRSFFGLIQSAQASVWNATPELKEKFTLELEAELSARIRTLKRDIRVYHYGTHGPNNYAVLNPDGNPAQPTPLKINSDEAIDLKCGNSVLVEDYMSPVELHPVEAATYFRAMSGLMSSAPNK